MPFKLPSFNRVNSSGSESSASVSAPPPTKHQPGTTKASLHSMGKSMQNSLQSMFSVNTTPAGIKKYEVKTAVGGFLDQSLDAHKSLAQTTSNDSLNSLANMLAKDDVSQLLLASEKNGVLRRTTTSLQSIRDMGRYAKLDGKAVTPEMEYFSKSAANLLDTDITRGNSFQSMGTPATYKTEPFSLGLSNRGSKIIAHMEQVALLGQQLEQYQTSPGSFKVPAQPLASDTLKVENAVSTYTNMANVGHINLNETPKPAGQLASTPSTPSLVSTASTATTASTTDLSLQSSQRNSSVSTAASSTTSMPETKMPIVSANQLRRYRMPEQKTPLSTPSTTSTPTTQSASSTPPAVEQTGASLTRYRKPLKPRVNRPMMQFDPSSPGGQLSRTRFSNASLQAESTPQSATSSSAESGNETGGGASLKRSTGRPTRPSMKPGFQRVPDGSRTAEGQNTMSRREFEAREQAAPLLQIIQEGRISPQDNPVIYNHLEHLASRSPEVAAKLSTLLANESPASRELRQLIGF